MNNQMTPKALNELGDKYFHGQGTPVNIELAYTYYKQAADAGNPVGLYNVGKYFQEKKDYKGALDYYQRSLSSGYSRAYLTLATMAIQGLGMRKSKKKAFKYTFEGASLGDTDAYVQLAKYYHQAIGCKRDDKKVWEYYQKAADLGNPEGMYNLALLMLETPKGKKDPQAALGWLDKAGEAGYREAIIKARELYQKPHPAFKKRSVMSLSELAFHYEELLAGCNDEQALIAVSLAYFEGTNITKRSPEKALRYFKKLVEIDHPVGHYGYGSCLIEGLGIEKDCKLGLKHLETSASRGNEAAMGKLGDAYRLGQGVPPDPETAKKWYYEAAKHNNHDALLNLGLLHYRGEIMNPSAELAYQYVENAVKKGSTQAYYWLGVFFEKGIGCPKDLGEAQKAFQKAIALKIVSAAYKYGCLLYEEALLTKSKRKADILFQKAKEQLINYVKSVQPNVANAGFASFYLASIYQNGYGVEPSQRTMRYWLELSAGFGFPKAMVEMYRLLKPSEFNLALKYLKRAVEVEKDPEAIYEMGLLYLEGYASIEKNTHQANKYFELAAKLSYKPALDRLMMR